MIDDYDFSKDVPPTEAERTAWSDGNKNIFDPEAPQGSIWQNRPTYHFEIGSRIDEPPIERKPLPIIEAGSKKDWNAKPSKPTLPPKDWSKLGR